MEDVKNMDIDAMFTSATEKTFQYDAQLPSLPVPTLQHTLDRYLDSVRPHVSADDFRQTEFIVQQFASGVGKDLHKQLLKKAETEKNWLEAWWLDYAYMDFRLPLAPYLNFGGPGPYMHHNLPKKEGTSVERAGLIMHLNLKYWQMILLSADGKIFDLSAEGCYKLLSQWWENYAYMDFRLPICPFVNFAGPGPYMYHYLPSEDGSQVTRTSFLVHFCMKFWQHVKKERIRPDKDNKGQRLCMNQFRRLFSTCRIPAPQRDHLKTYFRTEAEGSTPLHMTVLCRGRIFVVKGVDANEEPLTPPELQEQFQYIRDKCDSEPEGPGVGALTGDNRTTWAENRSYLSAIHPQNYENLEIIQQSIMCVIFDDSCPQDETEVFQLALAGDSTNRWFDKSLTMIFFKNGLVASNCDHSPMDAMVLVASTFYVDLNVRKCQGKWQGSQEIRKFEMPRELVFRVDNVIERGISNAKLTYNTIANNLQCSVLHFTKYGKKFLRQFKLHPDTHVQMMLQYAYYKLYNKPAPTYQTGTTRKYYNARTETVRSCTPEAIQWAKAMLDPAATAGMKVALYRQAADKHNLLMAEATDNHGCDRHLFGMQILALEAGLPMPQIYTDPAYTKSGGGGNFVLSTSFVGYTPVYGGVVPMVEHGYGTFYRVEQTSISVFVSAWKSCAETDAVKFSNMIQQCLLETGDLLEKSANTARL